MGTELAPHEPIKLPDPRRPAILPSLPGWLARSTAAVRLDLQLDPVADKFRDVLVLPAEMLPSPMQRQEMRAHMDSLRCYLRQTPAESVEAENAVAISVSKLLVVLAGERKSELSEGARADVYLDVLEDAPWWAVQAAVKLWFRHDCGTDERGKPHNYVFAPDPGTLRKIALAQTWEIGGRINKLQRVLEARQYVDCSAQLEAGGHAMRGLQRSMGDPEAMKTMTFERAVAIGKEPEKTAMPASQPATEPAR